VNDLPQCLRVGALDCVIDPEMTRMTKFNASSKFRSELSVKNNSESSLKLVMGNGRVEQEKARAKMKADMRRREKEI